MIVAASTECFPSLPLDQAVSRLFDLEFTSVEIAIHEGHAHLRPDELLDDLERVLAACRSTQRMNIVAYSLDADVSIPRFYDQFTAVCRLAKATKVVQITVPSGELGTPFNEEVERLRRLVDLALLEGARVSIKTQVGRLSEDPDTVVVLCDNVKGLGVTLDPSHFVCGPHRQKNFEKLFKYVYHVQLRDTSKTQMQVRVGQGEIEYGRLAGALRKQGYDRALSVSITEMPDAEHAGELRKLRLLLESLL